MDVLIAVVRVVVFAAACLFAGIGVSVAGKWWDLSRRGVDARFDPSMLVAHLAAIVVFAAAPAVVAGALTALSVAGTDVSTLAVGLVAFTISFACGVARGLIVRARLAAAAKA